MRVLAYFLYCLLGSTIFLVGQPIEKPKRGASIQILKESKLYLEGRSNVNEFTCHCEQEVIPMTTDFSIDVERTIADFFNLALNISTQKLDCGHKIMNKDLQKTLQVDQHPYIKIKLQKVHLNRSKSGLNQFWTHYLAETDLTIAGNTSSYKIPVMAKRIGAKTYQFKSFYEIQLSEFGIAPPTALLGVVKVEDTFIIHFDLHVEVLD